MPEEQQVCPSKPKFSSFLPVTAITIAIAAMATVPLTSALTSTARAQSAAP